MLSSKYVKYYRIDTFKTKSGKIKDRLVYVGPLYDWQLSSGELRPLKTRMVLVTVLSWLLFVVSLSFHSELSRVWNIVLPYAFLALVLMYMTVCCWKLLWKKSPFDQKMKDQTGRGLPGALITGICIQFFTFAESVFYMVKRQYHSPADIFFACILIILLLLLAVGIFQNKKLKFVEKENPLAEEWNHK